MKEYFEFIVLMIIGTICVTLSLFICLWLYFDVLGFNQESDLHSFGFFLFYVFIGGFPASKLAIALIEKVLK